MGYGFNPIGENDWQGLNIILEKLSSGQAEAAGTTKRTGPVVSRRVKEGVATVDADNASLVGVDDGQGISVYVQGDNEENVTMPEDSVVYKTQSKIAVPSSYFLDLRTFAYNDDYWDINADVLVLHNVNGDTITLTSIDETNYRANQGNGGRDQVADWTSAWVYAYVLYNPVSQDVTTRVSASATAPTLPTGYTFYVRVGSAWVDGSGNYKSMYQMNDVVTYNVQWPKWDTHVTTPATFEEVNLASYVPPTAKMVHGVMGLSAGVAAKKMRVAADAGVVYIGALCDAAGTGDQAFGVSGSKDFKLPMPTAQKLWWDTETNTDIYAVGITGYTDDL